MNPSSSLRSLPHQRILISANTFSSTNSLHFLYVLICARVKRLNTKYLVPHLWRLFLSPDEVWWTYYRMNIEERYGTLTSTSDASWFLESEWFSWMCHQMARQLTGRNWWCLNIQPAIATPTSMIVARFVTLTSISHPSVGIGLSTSAAMTRLVLYYSDSMCTSIHFLS